MKEVSISAVAGLCLLAAASLFAQDNPAVTPNPVGESKITGIKMVPSNRPDHSAFINDSAKTITAYRMCNKESCSTWDGLVNVIDYNIVRAKRPHLPQECGHGDECHLLQPGRQDSRLLDRGAIVAVIYEDSTFEGNADSVQAIMATRRAVLAAEQNIISIAKTALGRGGSNPIQSAVDELLKTFHEHDHDPGEVLTRLVMAMDRLKSPKWDYGDTTEFIPPDQQAFLRTFLADRETFVRQFAQHCRIRGGQ